MTLAVVPAFILAVAFPVHAGVPQPGSTAAPQEAIRRLVDSASTIVADPALQGAVRKAERRDRVATIIHDAFDFASMARDSLGPQWGTLTPGQREEFTRLFGERFKWSYSLLVLQFLGERTTAYVSEAIDGSRAVVRTILVSQKDGNLPVEYRLGSRGDHWAVEDVVVDGVSLAANYRAQFSRIIRTSSYETLLRRLRKPVE
jgi:phospholipid transport system substrate-binding protein